MKNYYTREKKAVFGVNCISRIVERLISDIKNLHPKAELHDVKILPLPVENDYSVCAIVLVIMAEEI